MRWAAEALAGAPLASAALSALSFWAAECVLSVCWTNRVAGLRGRRRHTTQRHPRGLAAQRPSGPAAQRPSGPAARMASTSQASLPPLPLAAGAQQQDLRSQLLRLLPNATPEVATDLQGACERRDEPMTPSGLLEEAKQHRGGQQELAERLKIQAESALQLLRYAAVDRSPQSVLLQVKRNLQQHRAASALNCYLSTA
jgi:hypothetical protein